MKVIIIIIIIIIIRRRINNHNRNQSIYDNINDHNNSITGRNGLLRSKEGSSGLLGGT